MTPAGLHTLPRYLKGAAGDAIEIEFEAPSPHEKSTINKQARNELRADYVKDDYLPERTQAYVKRVRHADDDNIYSSRQIPLHKKQTKNIRNRQVFPLRHRCIRAKASQPTDITRNPR